MLTNDQAVCIRAIDYSETSQVVTFFTRQNGKLTVIAKGSKRPRWPFGGPLEVFSCGRIVFSDSRRDKLATLVEFEPIHQTVDYSVLTGDVFVLNCCLFAAELVNILTEDYDSHPGLYDGLIQFIHDISRCKVAELGGGKVLVLLILFQLKLLREIGLSPVLESCANCKNPFSKNWSEIFFSSSARGFICADCQGAFPDKIKLTLQGAKCFANVRLLESAQINTIRQIEDIIIQYITDAIGRMPKMAKYIL